MSVGHQHFMQQALALAEQGRFTTSPNPSVGCLIVQDGQIVGSGYHARAGQPHAEIHALNAAGFRACGADVYVTLEPCAHQGRTPACADALIRAGVGRVITAVTDPNPKVAGQGHARLQNAGIEVITDVLAEQAEALNRGFFKRQREQRPWVTLKLAQSLDGKGALSDGRSQWITSEQARLDVHRLRAEHCAVLTGVDTVLIDHARLNVRLTAEQLGINEPVRQPVRVVLDSGLRLTPFAPMFFVDAPVWVYTRDAESGIHQDGLTKRGAELITTPGNPNRPGLDLDAILADLADREVNRVMVEAGAKLAGSFLAQDLVDELVVYQAPMLLGNAARPACALSEVAALDDARRWQLSAVDAFDQDVRLTLRRAH